MKVHFVHLDGKGGTYHPTNIIMEDGTQIDFKPEIPEELIKPIMELVLNQVREKFGMYAKEGLLEGPKTFENDEKFPL